MSNISNKNIGLKKWERNSSVLDKTPHSRKYKNEEKLSESSENRSENKIS